MHLERLGRAGPRLSDIGVHGPATPAFLAAADTVGINWIVLDMEAPVPGGARTVPPAWALLLLGARRDVVTRTLTHVGRAAAEVVFARDEDEWASAMVLAATGVARCVGLVTDDVHAIEACSHQRHVDAVWAATAPDASLVQLCRWSGTGLLLASDTIRQRPERGPVAPAPRAAD